MQLQKGPVALLGAFALKVLGQNPPQFGDAVLPTVDVYDQYLASGELQSKLASGNLALALQTANTFTVPAGKAWRLIGAGGATGLAAADAALVLDGTVTILTPLSTTQGCPIFGRTVSGLGQAPRSFGVLCRPPIFLPPGYTVVVNFNFSAAPTVAQPYTATVLVQEMDT